jgi:Flp pilus assembly pilin Flp
MMSAKTKLETYFSSLYNDENGAVATEYALLIVFIALLAAVGMIVLGQGLATLFSGIGTALGGAAIPSLPVIPVP